MELPLTEEELELLEPAPDIHALFVHYNELYFESKLGACSGEWLGGLGRHGGCWFCCAVEVLAPATQALLSFVSFAVEWSSARMTRCGGTCELLGGGAGGCRIKLSKPLLQVPCPAARLHNARFQPCVLAMLPPMTKWLCARKVGAWL